MFSSCLSEKEPLYQLRGGEEENFPTFTTFYLPSSPPVSSFGAPFVPRSFACACAESAAAAALERQQGAKEHSSGAISAFRGTANTISAWRSLSLGSFHCQSLAFPHFGASIWEFPLETL